MCIHTYTPELQSEIG